METNWPQWGLAGVGALVLLLLKSQSHVAARRCADVFNQHCKTAPFYAPLWQTAVTLIAQLGCLSWWLTERVVTPVPTGPTMEGVTDAFGDLSTHPPFWSYLLLLCPAALEVVALTMLYVALSSLPVSCVLAVFSLGYVAYRVFTTCMGQSRLQPTDYASFALLVFAAIFIAWSHTETMLHTLNHDLPTTPASGFASLSAAKTGSPLTTQDIMNAEGVAADAPQLIDGMAQPPLSTESLLLIDSIIFGFLLGLTAGAVYTLRLIIVEGLMHRFRFHYMQALGLEGLYGLVMTVVALTVADSIMFEDSGVTMFQLITNSYLVYSTLGFMLLFFLYLLGSYYLVSGFGSFTIHTRSIFGKRSTKVRASERVKAGKEVEDVGLEDFNVLYPVAFLYRVPFVLLGELLLGGSGWCKVQGIIGRSMLILVSIIVAKNKQRNDATVTMDDVERSIDTELAAYSEILRAQRSSYLNDILSSTKAQKRTQPCPLCVAEEFEQENFTTRARDTSRAYDVCRTSGIGRNPDMGADRILGSGSVCRTPNIQ